MAKRFAIPLKQSRYRKVTPAPNGTSDYAFIGKVYRERLGGPFYPVVPNKPTSKCGIGSCDYVYDPNTGESRGKCQGSCCY